MRLNKQTLQSRSRKPLVSTDFIDLRSLSIDSISGGSLGACRKLATLILRDNQISAVEDLTELCELWKLDLTTNEVRTLDGLVPFQALGSLFLAKNQLELPELKKISHLHILELSLWGNPELEKLGEAYRPVLVHCLPNVWSLDGIFVTDEERLQSAAFCQAEGRKHEMPFVEAPIPDGSRKSVRSTRASALLASAATGLHHSQRWRLKTLARNYEDARLIEERHLMKYRHKIHSSQSARFEKYDKYSGFTSSPPALHIFECMELPLENRVQMMMLLLGTLKYHVSKQLQEDAMKSFLPHSVPRDMIGDIVALPPFARMALLIFVQQSTDVDQDTELYVNRQTADQIRLAVTGEMQKPGLSEEELEELKELYENEPLINVHETVARHLISVLGKSPLFKSKELELQQVFADAGLSTRAPSRPPTRSLSVSHTHGVPVGVTPENAQKIYKLDDQDSVSDDVYKRRIPSPGERVLIATQRLAVIAEVYHPGIVMLKPYEGSTDGDLFLTIRDLYWMPQGKHWRLRSRTGPQEIAVDPHATGFPSRSLYNNLQPHPPAYPSALHQVQGSNPTKPSEVPLPLRKPKELHLFAHNNMNQQKYALCPPTLVKQENQKYVNQGFRPGWSSIHNIPYSSLEVDIPREDVCLNPRASSVHKVLEARIYNDVFRREIQALEGDDEDMEYDDFADETDEPTTLGGTSQHVKVEPEASDERGVTPPAVGEEMTEATVQKEESLEEESTVKNVAESSKDVNFFLTKVDGEEEAEAWVDEAPTAPQSISVNPTATSAPLEDLIQEPEIVYRPPEKKAGTLPWFHKPSVLRLMVNAEPLPPFASKKLMQRAMRRSATAMSMTSPVTRSNLPSVPPRGKSALSVRTKTRSSSVSAVSRKTDFSTPNVPTLPVMPCSTTPFIRRMPIDESPRDGPVKGRAHPSSMRKSYG